jgi:uncharacterized membrane protein YcjF (UPF0283 family)
MAFCPECNGEMAANDALCPHCGYDFPPEPDPIQKRSGFAYSSFASVALFVGAIVVGFAAIVWVLRGIGWVYQEEYWLGFVVAPAAFFLSLAMLVVFLRVIQLK